VGSGGAGDDLLLDTVSHGELVYRVLRDELDALVIAAGGNSPTAITMTAPALPAGAVRTLETSAEWTLREGAGSYRIRLVVVDAAGLTTSNVINGIRESMAQLAREGFQRFVLNLSFVVLPCNPLALLNSTNQQDLLQSYLTLAASDPTLQAGLSGALGVAPPDVDLATLGGRLAEVDKAVLSDVRLSALRGCLVDAVYRQVERDQNLGESEIGQQLINDVAWENFQRSVVQGGGQDLAVIAVGAAGNGVQCGKSRRAPALWDGVVSVSSEGRGAGIMDYSNSGEVKLSGEGPAALLPGSHGTSFAAPRLSAYEAIYLLRTGRIQCPAGRDRPPLAYVDSAAVLGAATTGALVWLDEGRPTWPHHCADFRAVTGA
jgi:hypothetical protein